MSLQGMRWIRLRGGDWYVEGGYFVRFDYEDGEVWWAVPVKDGKR